MYGGRPARSIRPLAKGELESVLRAASRAVSLLAGVHSLECSKDQSQIDEDALVRHDRKIRDPDHFQPDYVGGGFVDKDDVLGQGAPGRIWNSTLSHPKGEDGPGWVGNKRAKQAQPKDKDYE